MTVDVGVVPAITELPEKLDVSVGWYKTPGGITVQVHSTNDPTACEVRAIAATPLRFTTVELMPCQATIDAKDYPPNDELLVTSGLPNDRGIVSHFDTWLFHAVEQLVTRGLTLECRHLRAAYLHHFLMDRLLGIPRHRAES